MAKPDLARLEALGFLRYVRPEDLERVRRELAAHFLFAEGTHRRYHADAESLAERGVLDFLGEVAPLLRREGVPIEVVYREVKYPASKTRPGGRGAARLNADGWLDEDGPQPLVERIRVSFAPGAEPCELTEDDSDDLGIYILYAGDRKIVIYDGSEPDDDTGDDWQRTTRVTLAILNELLSAHGSAERAYALSRGNDLDIVFATPEMAQIINAAEDDPREMLHDGTG